MKKTFIIQVEYPDCDFVSSEEIAEVAQECIDQYLERYFGANIMDGDYDRIKVKEVTDFISLVKQMRKAQNRTDNLASGEDIDFVDMLFTEQREAEREVDKYLKKIEEII